MGPIIEKAKSIWAGLTSRVNHTLDLALEDKESKVMVLAMAILLEVLLAYILAIISVGIWIGNISPIAIIVACFRGEGSFPWALFLLLSALLLGGIYYFLYKSLFRKDDRNFTYSDANTYGSAREIAQAELEEVADVCSREEATGTVLGQLDRSEENLISTKAEPRGNRNIAVFGASGSGKSFCFVKPFIVQAIRRGESVLVTDSKGEIWADTVELARSYGYIVRRIDLKDPLFSDGWDVLGELRHSDQRANVFVDTIMYNTGDPEAQFFDAQKSLLLAVCLYQERNQALPPETRSLPSAYDMLLMGEKELIRTFEQVKYDPELQTAYKAFAPFASASDRAKGNILASLMTRLRVALATPENRNMISTPDIDLSLPGKKRCIYYIAVSDQHQSMKFLSSLFFNFAYLDLCDYADKQMSRRLPIPVNFLMEEFYSCVGYLPNLSQYLATCRSRAINFILVLQDMPQLYEIYGESVTSSIIGNCATHLSLGFNDKITAEYFEWRSGEATIEVRTDQHDAVDSLYTVFGLRHSTGDGRRHVYTSHELMTMPFGKCFIVWQRYNCKMAHTLGINRYIEYEKGRMPSILPEVHIPLADTEAKAFLRAAEEQRVLDYEAWIADGGNPWKDYKTPEHTTQGPATGTDLPDCIPYPKLEEMALEHSEQARGTARNKLRDELQNRMPQPEPDVDSPMFEFESELIWENPGRQEEPEEEEDAADISETDTGDIPGDFQDESGEPAETIPPPKSSVPEVTPAHQSRNAIILDKDAAARKSRLASTMGAPGVAGRRPPGELYGKKPYQPKAKKAQDRKPGS